MTLTCPSGLVWNENKVPLDGIGLELNAFVGSLCSWLIYRRVLTIL